MPKLCLQAAVGIGAFFLADDAHARAAETAEAADDRRILAVAAVARERHEIGDELADIIKTMRPLRMACHLRLLPGRQRRVELFERLVGLDLDAVDLLADGDGIAAGGHRPHFLDLGLKLGHRLFEIEIGAHHANGPVIRRLKRRAEGPPTNMVKSRKPARSDDTSRLTGFQPAQFLLGHSFERFQAVLERVPKNLFEHIFVAVPVDASGAGNVGPRDIGMTSL